MIDSTNAQDVDALDAELAELTRARTEQQTEEAHEEARLAKVDKIAKLRRDMAHTEKWREIQKAENGRVLRVVTDMFGMFVFRVPKRGRWDEFQDTVSKTGELTSQDAYLLLHELRVFPESASDLDAALDRQPALTGDLAKLVAQAAGQGSAKVAKK